MTTQNYTPKISLSFYELSLMKYLLTYHPDLADDIKFIKARADRAIEEEINALKSGCSYVGAEELSRKVLYDGLEFSFFETIQNLLEPLCPADELRNQALELLPILRPFLEKYEINDSFGGSAEYDELCVTLKNEIKNIYGI